MHPQLLAALATVLSFTVQGNRVEFQLDRGAAEIAWTAPDVFRFRRSLDGPLAPVDSAEAEKVDLKVDDLPGVVRMRSKYIEVTVRKAGALVSVRLLDGEPLMSDLSEPRAEAERVAWERAMPAGTRYYGLGRRTEQSLDWRGKTADAETPFLISSAGYGEYHLGGGSYRFDFTAAGRYGILAPRVDYFFYYGPRPNHIFQSRAKEPEARTGALPAARPPASWNALRDELLRLTHGVMAGILSPSFDLASYAAAPADLLARARQIGSLVPDVTAGSVPFSDFRSQLKSYYESYAVEKRDRGYPVWHPLPFQFPDDPECAQHADEFLLGDEMLIAPIYDASGKRQVYLPQGVWTNLETNEALPGRQTITVETRSLPVFARNGTIIPLNSPNGMALHYFPKLAAEFFVLEADASDWTQAHASPAADIFRLEIQAKAARDYQWVVHHVDAPAAVGFEDQKYQQASALDAMTDRSWFYDKQRRNLHIRARVAAGETSVIHVSW